MARTRRSGAAPAAAARVSAVAGLRSRARTDALGVVWVVAVQFVAMTALAAVLGTWQDEEYTLSTTAHGVGNAVHRAISYELQAPLYFGMLAALRQLDPSVFFARMFSVVAACALTPLAALIARRIWPATDVRVFAALVAFNPFVVFAAVEIRLYALALLISAALWLAFDFGFLGGSKPQARVALGALAIAAVYLQYFLGFEVAAFGVALVVARRWRSLVAYVAAMLVVGIAFLPLALVLRSQVNEAFDVRASLPGAYGSVLLHPLLDFVLPIGYEVFLGSGHRIVVALSAIVLVGLLVAGRPRPNRRAWAIVAIALTIELIYVFLANVLHDELTVPRHFVALFVPEAAALYALVAAFTARRARTYATAIACAVALTTAASLAATYRTLGKQGDWPRVGAFLTKEARPGDSIAVYPADGTLPLARYYRGSATVVPFPRALSTTTYNAANLFVHSPAEATAELGARAQHGRLWLVTFGGCTKYDFYGCLALETAVSQHFRVVETHHFYANDVLRLDPLAAQRAVHAVR